MWAVGQEEVSACERAMPSVSATSFKTGGPARLKRYPNRSDVYHYHLDSSELSPKAFSNLSGDVRLVLIIVMGRWLLNKYGQPKTSHGYTYAEE